MIVGTAGHIDHGKTALVRALTGIDTDRLAEEKRRGITIDIGFANLELAGASGEKLRGYAEIQRGALPRCRRLFRYGPPFQYQVPV